MGVSTPLNDGTPECWADQLEMLADDPAAEQVDQFNSVQTRMISTCIRPVREHFRQWIIRRSHSTRGFHGLPLTTLKAVTPEVVSVKLSAAERGHFDQFEKNSADKDNPFYVSMRRWLKDPFTVENGFFSRAAGPSSAVRTLGHRLLRWLNEQKGRPESEQEKTVVYMTWTSLMPIVQAHLDGMGVPTVRLTGDMSALERAQICHAFQRDESQCADVSAPYTSNGTIVIPRPAMARILFVSDVGQTGINLHRANRLHIFDPLWSHHAQIQLMGRICRLGQVREPHVYIYYHEDTFELRFKAMLERKQVTHESMFTAPNESASQIQRNWDLAAKDTVHKRRGGRKTAPAQGNRNLPVVIGALEPPAPIHVPTSRKNRQNRNHSHLVDPPLSPGDAKLVKQFLDDYRHDYYDSWRLIMSADPVPWDIVTRKLCVERVDRMCELWEIDDPQIETDTLRVLYSIMNCECRVELRTQLMPVPREFHRSNMSAILTTMIAENGRVSSSRLAVFPASTALAFIPAANLGQLNREDDDDSYLNGILDTLPSDTSDNTRIVAKRLFNSVHLLEHQTPFVALDSEVGLVKLANRLRAWIRKLWKPNGPDHSTEATMLRDIIDALDVQFDDFFDPALLLEYFINDDGHFSQSSQCQRSKDISTLIDVVSVACPIAYNDEPPLEAIPEYSLAKALEPRIPQTAVTHTTDRDRTRYISTDVSEENTDSE